MDRRVLSQQPVPWRLSNRCARSLRPPRALHRVRYVIGFIELEDEWWGDVDHGLRRHGVGSGTMNPHFWGFALGLPPRYPHFWDRANSCTQGRRIPLQANQGGHRRTDSCQPCRAESDEG
jgi:hypothetical protein